MSGADFQRRRPGSKKGDRVQNDPSEERFEVYDEAGRKIGLATRAACHGNPRLIHRTAHVIVFNDRGDLLLQKRSPRKDIQPGKWDTAVGGHLIPGETWERAAEREMREELGVCPASPLRMLFVTAIRNAIESENVGVFTTIHNGPFSPPPDEIDELCFWSARRIREAMETGCFTPSLEAEIRQLCHLNLLAL
jgi:isopentenyldiphosphate isomerase